MNQTIVLIGMPQSGKTTIGKQVADHLGYDFIDIDSLIEKEYSCRRGKSLNYREIYKKEGADYFRSLETEAFKSVIDQQKMVIATGGGSPVHISSFKKLTDQSSVFFIYCTFDTLWKRISSMSEVPAMISHANPFANFQELYKNRLVHYLALSHYKIDATQKSVDEISSSLIDSLKK